MGKAASEARLKPDHRGIDCLAGKAKYNKAPNEMNGTLKASQEPKKDPRIIKWEYE